MKPTEIKRALEDKGWHYSDIARSLGKSPQFVGQVARGVSAGRAAAQAIAAVLDLPLEIVFPKYRKRS